MNEDTFNMEVRKFLKRLGVTSQREIEQAVREAVAAGKLPDDGRVTVTARVTADNIDLDVEVKGDIGLE